MNVSLEHLREWLAKQYSTIGLTLEEEFGSGVSCVARSLHENKLELLDAQLGAWVRFSLLASKEDTADIVAQDVRWALDSISGLEIRSGIPPERSDSLGAWQVHVIWVVPAICRESWEQAIREVRSRSAHPEEVGLDALILGSRTIEASLTEDGIPLLLFKARSLLALASTDMPKWLSPDSAFGLELRATTNSFGDEVQKAFFESFLLEAMKVGVTTGEEHAVEFFPTGRVSINNFRNIVDAEISLLESDEPTIIHGPNGSGKSSIFEAICLAMTGASNRLIQLLGDADVSQKIKSDYVGTVLTRFGVSDGERLRLHRDGVDIIPELIADKQKATQRLRDARGTVLAQEDALKFVQMTAAEAAALVLGDYSPLARNVQRQAESGLQDARNEWQAWLRSLGLIASITKRETILRKIIDRTLAQNFPANPVTAFSWMDAVTTRFPEFQREATRVRADWTDVDSQAGRELIADQLVRTIMKSQNAEPLLLDWIRRRNTALIGISQVCESWADAIDPLREHWPQLKEELLAFADWLQASSRAAAEQPATASGDEVAATEGRLEAALAELAPKGQILRQQKEHLDSLRANFLKQWQSIHPHNCPTCNAHYDENIGNVITTIAEDVETRYAQVRDEYSRIQAELRDARKAAAIVGKCPVSNERLGAVSRLLNFDLSGPSSLEANLRSTPAAVSSLVQAVERILPKPVFAATHSDADLVGLARDISIEISQFDAEGQRKQELPELWGKVKKTVDAVALRVIGDHLPKTIGSIWSELCFALAPSRWNQSSIPKLSLETTRGSEKLSILVSRASNEIPVRHILNQAEQHVLGLAWFFASYLLHGRFRTKIIVLDDPAHEMDQVTYRKFVRFLQAFTRLHRSRGDSLRMITFLHQEERALDLARATTKDGALTILEWAGEIRSRGPSSTLRQLQLRNPSQRAPLPPPLAQGAAVIPT